MYILQAGKSRIELPPICINQLSSALPPYNARASIALLTLFPMIDHPNRNIFEKVSDYHATSEVILHLSANHSIFFDKWSKPEDVPDTERHHQASFCFAESFQDRVRYNTP